MDEIEILREQNAVWGRDVSEAHRMLDRAGIPQMERHADRVKWLLAEVRVLRENLGAIRSAGLSRLPVADANFLTAMSEPVSAQDVVNIVADCVTDSGRLAWPRGMHTLHYDADISHIADGYTLTVTSDGYTVTITSGGVPVAEYECHSSEYDSLGDAFRAVIGRAAAEWRNGKRIGAGK